MKLIITILFVSCIIGCNTWDPGSKNQTAIRDFDKNLQHYLVRIVSTGIVGFDSATIHLTEHASDKELLMLSKSEHPILRAVAFREMLQRPSFDHFDLIMNNLDDTAMVYTDWGEWGYKLERVSDDLVQNANWKDTAAKNKTIDAILTRHNYLSTAYYIAPRIKTNEKYYRYFRHMATRNRRFDEREDVLLALPGYQKPEDIPLLAESLLINSGRLSQSSFELMLNYPQDSYMQVFEKIYPKLFYRRIIRDREISYAENFINSIAVYKNQRSAGILDSILNRKPFMPVPIDENWLKRVLAYAITNNKCEAYTSLIKQVNPLIKKIEAENAQRGNIELPLDPVPRDTSAEPIRWW